MQVYTFTYKFGCGDDCTEVFSSLEGAIERLKITAHHGHFEIDESIVIRCENLVTDEEIKLRRKRVCS